MTSLTQTSTHSASPIAILGGGPVGLVTALLLARAGMSATLIDARPVADLQRDRRLLALSQGSCLLLEDLLGAPLKPSAAIRKVHVCSQAQAGHTRLLDREFSGRPLGVTMWFADLVTALDQAVAAQPLIAPRRPCRWGRIEAESAGPAVIALDNADPLSATLVIAAEGTPANLPAPAQCGVLADVLMTRFEEHLALERFTREGPLALLPLPSRAPAAPDGGDARWMSMVWCLPSDLAHERAALPPAALCAAIGTALGPRWGRPLQVGQPAVFPLHTHRLAEVCSGRLVRIGNAAQTLHPVAGQGFNLGLRDAAVLVDCLVEARRLAQAQAAGFDPLSALPGYARRRRRDRLVLPSLTSALPGLFSSSLAPLSVGRSVGLAAVDLIAPARRAMGRLLMFGAG